MALRDEHSSKDKEERAHWRYDTQENQRQVHREEREAGDTKDANGKCFPWTVLYLYSS